MSNDPVIALTCRLLVDAHRLSNEDAIWLALFEKIGSVPALRRGGAERLLRIAADLLPDDVPAMSLMQPYAGLCAAVPDGNPPWAAGLKSLETRAHRTTLRGPLVICSTQVADGDAWHRLNRDIPEWALPICDDPRGVAMVLVEVIGCQSLVTEDEPRSWFYAPDRWAWELAWARPLKPFPVKGMPGRFKVSKRLVLEALAAPRGEQR